MNTYMKHLLHHRILATVLVAMAVMASFCSCDRKSAKEQLQEAMVQTQKQLPKLLDEDITWMKASYDRSANEILFEYSSRKNHALSEDERRLVHEMMVGQVFPAFENDGERMVGLIRKLRPKVRYIYRWEGDDHVWLDDTCRADEYL